MDAVVASCGLQLRRDGNEMAESVVDHRRVLLLFPVRAGGVVERALRERLQGLVRRLPSGG